MKINCNYSKGNKCTTCKHEIHCTLLEPTNKNHTLLQREINYWLNELRKIRQNIREYEHVLTDILNHKYSYTINVYGNIQYAPKQNVFGVFIKKPEHVFYGWNYQKLTAKKEELIEHIRLLNRKELNMRRILERGNANGY